MLKCLVYYVLPPWYNACGPIASWVVARMLKLAGRVLFLTVVMFGASLVLADIVIVTGLIMSTTALFVVILVLERQGVRSSPGIYNPIRDRGKSVTRGHGQETS